MLRVSFVRHVSCVSVVLFLMTCLKAEVAQAEASLLVAAASCPLYGRAHCITAALQQLSTGYGSTLVYTKLGAYIYHCILSCYNTSSKWLCVCVFVCRSLQLQAEWSQVVSDLVALCYRMSDVVSPVVQSSSPEGLIPMDTNSG